MWRPWMLGLLCLAAGLPHAAADDEARFDILEFEISGNSVLATAAVEQAVLPFLGEQRRLADVEAARTALEKAYQDAGYLTVYVDVPEQRIDAGLVQLRVTEGRVERLRVTGSRYHDQGWLRERVSQLAPGTVPDFNAMQRQLAAASRDERQIQPLLRPGLTPGTVEAELRVADRLPLSTGLELNNAHAAGTSPLRAQATVRYDNLFQREHGLALTFITAPLDVAQSKVLSLGYTVPLQPQASLAVSLVLSDSTVEPLGAATVIGKGTTLGLRWARSAARPQSLHTLTAGIDLKDFRERVEAEGTALSTPLRYAPLSAAYNGQWFGDSLQATLASTLTVGLRNVLARQVDCPGNIGPVDQFACKREGADGSFATWRSDLRASWSGFTLRLAGQLATQPLVSSEQFSIGGSNTVRGYAEAEAAGDLAFLAGLEWRSANLVPRPEPGAGRSPWLGQLVAIAFAEAARSTVLEPSAGQAARVPLAGAGVGLRLRAAPSLEADLDLAWPLKSSAATTRNDPKLHVRLAAQF